MAYVKGHDFNYGLMTVSPLIQHKHSPTHKHTLTHKQTATNASTNTNKTRFGFVIYASFDACFKRKQFVWWVFYPNIVIIYFRFYVRNALIGARTCVCVLWQCVHFRANSYANAWGNDVTLLI